MAKPKFKPDDDGFYRIKESQKNKLKEFLMEQMEDNPRTAKGNLSKKGINTKTIITDGPDGEYEAFLKGDGPKFKWNDKEALDASGRARTTAISANKPTAEVKEEAGKLWDELIGDKGSFTMGGETFTSKEQYQEFEAKRKNRLTLEKEHLNRADGMSHGHLVPPQHEYAVELYMQSAKEDPSANFASQDKVPDDFEQRLDKAGVPKDKTTVAKRHVGTAERIGDLPKDEKVLKIIKSEPEKALQFIRSSKIPNTIARRGKVLMKNPVVKKAGLLVPGVSLAIAGGIVTSDAAYAKENPSAKNYAKLGLSTFDAGLEVIDTFTAGFSTPLTMALQLATGAARYQIDEGTRSSSEMDMDARKAARRG